MKCAVMSVFSLGVVAGSARVYIQENGRTMSVPHVVQGRHTQVGILQLGSLRAP